MVSSLDVVIHFGPKMGDKTPEKRYRPLYKGLLSSGVQAVFLRVGEWHQDDADYYNNYSIVNPSGEVDSVSQIRRALQGVGNSE